jgi:hypothetical protein
MSRHQVIAGLSVVGDISGGTVSSVFLSFLYAQTLTQGYSHNTFFAQLHYYDFCGAELRSVKAGGQIRLCEMIRGP